MFKKLLGAVLAIGVSSVAIASVTVNINGTNYTIPEVGERGWGANVTSWIQAASSGLLQKAGGTFTLTADTDFGASYGLKSLYYKSRALNPASTGEVRLGNAEGIYWRNAGNSANLGLSVNASNVLTFNGNPLISGTALTASRAVVTDGSGILSSSAVTSTELEYVSGVTSAIQTQIDAKQSRSTLTTKGDLYVATASATVARQAVGSFGQVLTADSSQTNGIKWADPVQGVKSYITLNSGIEDGTTTGFTLGNVSIDATTKFPTGAPTFGSGTSGTLALTASASSPLAGSYSLLYADSAATTAGNFVATSAFTVDLEGQAKVMQWKVFYKASVNPTNGNFSGTTSNSFGFAIYDVTNSAWIQPAGVFNIVQNSGVGMASGTFQTTSNSTSYRIAMYNANASSGAISIQLDDFFLGPQITAAGFAGSDTETYTSTLSGVTGGTATVTAMKRRVGDHLEVAIDTVWSSIFTGSDTPTFSIPSGLTIDTTKLPGADSSGRVIVGWGRSVDTGTATYDAIPVVVSSTTIGMYTAGAPSALITTTAPFTWANNDRIVAYFRVPIVGWSSQTVMSNDTDTRVVSTSVFRNTSAQTGIGTTPVKIQFNGVNFDTTGSFDSSTNYRYTVPVTGIYRHTGMIALTNVSANMQTTVQLRKNGSVVKAGINYNPTGFSSGFPFSFEDSAIAGDYYELFFATSTGTVDIISAASITNGSQWNMTRVSGPATIAASEDVIVAAQNNAGTAIANGGTPAAVPFAVETIDTHSAFDGATGVFTAPVSGKYEIASGLMLTSGGGWAAGEEFNLEYYKNNTTVIGECYSFAQATHSTYATVYCAPVITSLNAGDTLRVRAYQTSGGSLNLTSTVGENVINIKRVGN